MTKQKQEKKGGLISAMLLLFSVIGGIITLISAINVAFDLEWGLKVYGARTKLPTDWMSVIAIGIVCAITFGIYKLITSSRVRNQFRSKPWLKWMTPIVIIAGLSIGFYSVYYSIEYAGPLHYAARSNDLAAVEELLQENLEDRDYSEAVYECVELDHIEVLKTLLKDPKAAKNLKEDFILALEMGSAEVVITFIDAGVGTEGEYGDFLAEFLAVSEASDEEKEMVGLKFLETGSNPEGVYTGGYKGTDLNSLEQAKEQGLTKLVTAMEAN